jgi:hypothetical protein
LVKSTAAHVVSDFVNEFFFQDGQLINVGVNVFDF